MNGKDDQRDKMQRMRVGLTGLSVILLLVLLATAMFTRINGQVGNNIAASADKSDDEPLSDLGVVPRAPENQAAPQPPHAQRPKP